MSEMDQAVQGDQSGTPPVLPVKRKRGRPRKEQTGMEITPAPPGFQAVKKNQTRRADSVNDVSDGIVGQAVTGVVEAAFDAGYLLTVRIGNSDTCLRGVVFRPGHYLPITAENDVAPHAQMIKRNEMHIHGNNRARPSTAQNGSPLANQLRGLAQRTTNKTTPKAKYSSSIALSVPPVGARGTLVPVLLQPASMSNGSMGAHQVAPQGTSPELGDDEVHTVEPLAMLPPDVLPPTRTVPVAQTQSFPSQPHANQQVVAQGSAQNENASSNIATMTQKEDHKPVKPAEIHTPDGFAKVHERSSPSSGMHNKDNKEPNVFQEQPFRAVNSHLEQSIPVSQPLKSYPTGRMTELLLALQENISENQVPHAEHPSSSSDETDTDEDSRD